MTQRGLDLFADCLRQPAESGLVQAGAQSAGWLRIRWKAGQVQRSKLERDERQVRGGCRLDSGFRMVGGTAPVACQPQCESHGAMCRRDEPWGMNRASHLECLAGRLQGSADVSSRDSYARGERPRFARDVGQCRIAQGCSDRQRFTVLLAPEQRPSKSQLGPALHVETLHRCCGSSGRTQS